MLLYMFPAFAVDYSRNGGMSDPEHLRERGLRIPSLCVKGSDCAHLLLGQFGSTNGLATKYLFRVKTSRVSVAQSRALLDGHIMQIVDVGTKKQVSWIDTSCDITTMQDKQSRWYVAVSKDIRHSIGAQIAVSPSELTISSSRTTGSPKPACVWTTRFVNLRPEAISVFCGKIRSKHQNLHSGGPVGASTPRPAFVFPVSILQKPYVGNSGAI